MTSTVFVYEEAELNLLTRRPRSMAEKLVTPKIVYYNYALLGFMHFMGCILVL